MPISLKSAVPRLSISAVVALGIVRVEDLLAETLGDHMVATILMLIVAVFVVAWILPLLVRDTRS